jgi:hypothetical protein
MGMGIIGDESSEDEGCAPFLFQSSFQIIAPLLNEDLSF